MSVVLFAACSGCGNTQENVVPVDSTEVVIEDSVMNVEHTIATDRQAMYLKFGDNYRWYETCIRLPEFLDSEDVTSTPEMLVNIFQSIEEFDNGADTYVWKFQHFPDGTVLTDSIHGFWIEDCALNEEVFKLTYQDAFNKMLQANAPKPHSKNAILRNPVGPVAINAQWVFGNLSEQLWCDVVTGEIRNSNPAFPDNLKKPLGEWP